MISAKDVAWMAGLLEGEGSFWRPQTGGISLAVSMSDRDVVERFAAMVGGKVCEKRPTGISRLVQYRCSLQGYRAAAVAMTVLCFMGKRRSGKIKELLAAWLQLPIDRRVRTTCKRGHAASRGVCRPCINLVASGRRRAAFDARPKTARGASISRSRRAMFDAKRKVAA